MEGGRLSRLEFLVLSILETNEAISRFTGMTSYEIATADQLGYKENTIYKQLKLFEKNGFVQTGAKDGKSLTFYITDLGKCKLREEKLK